MNRYFIKLFWPALRSQTAFPPRPWSADLSPLLTCLLVRRFSHKKYRLGGWKPPPRSTSQMLQALGYGFGGGEFVEIAEDFGLAVLDEFIGPGDAFYGRVDAGFVQEFDHRSTKTVFDDVVLESANDAAFFRVAFDHSSIERLDETWIDQGDRITFFF